MLHEMNAHDYKRGVFTFSVGERDGVGEGRYGLWSETYANYWPTGNVYRMWKMLADNELEITADTIPGISALASVDDDGRTTVLLSCMDYRHDGVRPVTISGLPAGGVTAYLIDEDHSNLFDAGVDHADLETVAVTLEDNSVSIDIKPRSILLIVATGVIDGAIPGLVMVGDQPALLSSIVGESVDARSLTNYTDPDFMLPFGHKSHWIQPWRATVETPEASALTGGIGVNFNVTAEQADHSARLLAAKGFALARLEVGWNAIDYTTGDLTTGQATSLDARVQALSDHGIRPLILLNSNHQEPCPVSRFTGTVTAVADSTHVTLDSGTAAQVVLGKTGFDHDTRAAGVLITALAGNDATLSKALTLTPGTYAMTTLKYEPFGHPRLTGPATNTRYEATLTGWLDYVDTVATFMTAIVGADGFDLEIWNELSFGGDFLVLDRYYTADPETPPDPLVSETDDITFQLPRRTLAWIRANLDAGVGVGNGMASQRPWDSGANSGPFLTALCKHPYAGWKRYPGDQVEDGNEPRDALGGSDAAGGPRSWPSSSRPTTPCSRSFSGSGSRPST
jgi:hypothetical protein